MYEYLMDLPIKLLNVFQYFDKENAFRLPKNKNDFLKAIFGKRKTGYQQIGYIQFYCILFTFSHFYFFTIDTFFLQIFTKVYKGDVHF
jgi:hypothetical protein